MDRTTAITLPVVHNLNEAFNRHDVDAIMDLMADDCVFENTCPPPDGERFQGQAAVRACFTDLFRNSPHARFEFSDVFGAGERACVRWLYQWTEADGQPGHIYGVGVFRMRDGKIAEKLSYVKG
ncbi:MAG: nuclear transport factor 2 family protein [SAR202 cluster bacterium]|nr:nuclear transport factor 2 family protein [SAR202 cluster bacterium]